MGCETWRDALSARLDGEDAGVPDAALDAHLAGCADCTAWSARLDRLHRSVRIAPAGAVPDLTETILAAAAAARPRFAVPWSLTFVLRWALVVLAALEIGLAAPEFSGRWHAGGELGTWAVASAVGLLSVAMRPARAGGVLPMLACASVITLVVSARDVADGQALISAEWPHLLLLGGVVIITVLWRREVAGGEPGPDVRVSSEHGSVRERVRRSNRRAA